MRFYSRRKHGKETELPSVVKHEWLFGRNCEAFYSALYRRVRKNNRRKYFNTFHTRLSNVLSHYFDFFSLFLRRVGGNPGNYTVYYSSAVGGFHALRVSDIFEPSSKVIFLLRKSDIRAVARVIFAFRASLRIITSLPWGILTVAERRSLRMTAVKVRLRGIIFRFTPQPH